jgi:hypothetical protein
MIAQSLFVEMSARLKEEKEKGVRLVLPSGKSRECQENLGRSTTCTFNCGHEEEIQ